jgi:hypothetical protein
VRWRVGRRLNSGQTDGHSAAVSVASGGRSIERYISTDTEGVVSRRLSLEGAKSQDHAILNSSNVDEFAVTLFV